MRGHKFRLYSSGKRTYLVRLQKSALCDELAGFFFAWAKQARTFAAMIGQRLKKNFRKNDSFRKRVENCKCVFFGRI
jgi:hypothetical protein